MDDIANEPLPVTDEGEIGGVIVKRNKAIPLALPMHNLVHKIVSKDYSSLIELLLFFSFGNKMPLKPFFNCSI